LSRLSSQELAGIEAGAGGGSVLGGVEPLLTRLLPEKLIAVPLLARTRASALKGLVELAGRSGQVYLPHALHDAILDRERTSSTALDCGVAISSTRKRASSRSFGSPAPGSMKRPTSAS